MVNLLLEFIYRLLVTMIVLVPSLTAIVVAFTIVYNKDFNGQSPRKPKHKKEDPADNNDTNVP
ncbi:MAG: hypothetical protein Q4G58_13380 [bacterium]|nr:hypothetical protein [bacterium]